MCKSIYSVFKNHTFNFGAVNAGQLCEKAAVVADSPILPTCFWNVVQ